MQKCMSDYLDTVCASIHRSSLREAARGELSDHMIERYNELTNNGLNNEEAALETVQRMGDPTSLGKRISAANRPRSGLITAAIGAIVFIQALLYLMYAGSGNFNMFIDTPTFLGITLLSAAYGLLCCKNKPTLISFLQAVRTGSIYAGVISMIIGIINMLHCMSDKPDGIGYALSISLLSILYGVILSSVARAFENRLTSQKNSAILELIDY